MKHKFEGIGEASAAIIMAGLSTNPALAFLASGILGKIMFFIAKLFCMMLANLGLIVLNVGAAKLEVIIDEKNFDGSLEQAEAIIKKIRDTGRDLTDEEIKNIDQPVIDAFRKFANFGKLRKRRNPGF